MDDPVFMTSGSTGEPKRIVRSAERMRLDAETLANAFGPSFPPSPRFVASVRRDHFYGALWLGFLPPLLGGSVSPRVAQSAEDLLAEAREGRFVFVATPSFLEKVLRHPDARLLADGIADVVVSGGALRAATAEAAAALWGVTPLEIYGSTEAGTIAWRRKALTPFFRFAPGVSGEAQADGSLAVRSPFAMESPLSVRDAVRFVSPDSFEILGRADRMAKILENLVSLSAVERALESHPWVAEARVEPVVSGGVERLAALATLTPSGCEALAGGTYASVCADIRRGTIGKTGAAAFPRKIRFVSEMPSGPRGKVLPSAAKAELSRNCREPAVLSWKASAGVLEADLAFPPDGEWFDGHFDGFPVLPGVAQLYFARLYATRAFGGFPDAATYKNVKFRRPVRPGERVHLKIERKNGCVFSFEYSVDGSPASSGSVSALP